MYIEVHILPPNKIFESWKCRLTPGGMSVYLYIRIYHPPPVAETCYFLFSILYHDDKKNQYITSEFKRKFNSSYIWEIVNIIDHYVSIK